MMRTALFRLGAFGLAAAVAGTFFINVCHLIYDCGCVWLWAGGAAWCNIQTAGAPDCPFCAQPDMAYVSLWSTVGAQALIVFVPSRLRIGGRAAAALAAFPVLTVAFGVVLGLAAGYWS